MQAHSQWIVWISFLFYFIMYKKNRRVHKNGVTATLYFLKCWSNWDQWKHSKMCSPMTSQTGSRETFLHEWYFLSHEAFWSYAILINTGKEHEGYYVLDLQIKRHHGTGKVLNVLNHWMTSSAVIIKSRDGCNFSDSTEEFVHLKCVKEVNGLTDKPTVMHPFLPVCLVTTGY